MKLDNNIKSVIKYNGYSPLVKVKNKLLKKGRLFAAKLSKGYCFFQDAGEVFAHTEDGKIRDFQYFIFYESLFQEIPKKIKCLQSEKYFFKKRCVKSELEILIGCKGSNPKNNLFYSGQFSYYDLGIQKLPSDITPQRYFRSFEWNPYSNKTKLQLHDVFCWELFEYKMETPEYLTYPPDYGSIEATLKDFENDFTLKTWNLEWIQKNAEVYYAEHPYDRPTDETYDELKAFLPTIKFKEMFKGDSNKLGVNVKIEKALIAFSEGLIAEGKPTIGKAKKMTKELVLFLNKIEEETRFIETLEREELYAYIAKLLAKLRKTEAIEIIDECREW